MMTLQPCNTAGVPYGTLITFDSNLTWTDEFSWEPVLREATDTIEGAGLSIQETARINEVGRPVTLEGFNDMGWLSRATVKAIYDLSCIPYQLVKLTMTDAGVTVTKICRFAAKIEFQPVRSMNQILGDSFPYYGKIPLQVAKVSV